VIDLIIFDLDGVLVSTVAMHRDSLIMSIRINQGIDTTRFPELSGQSILSTLGKIKKIQSICNFPESQIPEILATKDRIFQEKIKKIKIEPNIIECLEYIKSKEILTAIATNSRAMNMNKILELTDLMKYFDTAVSANDVINRKPAPDMLFEIYKRLSVNGRNTLYIDDTDEGAAAGHNSLSTVIKINSPADLTIDLIKPWINNVR
jgi:HAD superfamily hydrolase (TIGR01509 family)